MAGIVTFIPTVDPVASGSVRTYEEPTGSPAGADGEGEVAGPLGLAVVTDVGDGAGEEFPPTPPGAGVRCCRPKTTATTAAAPRAMGTSLFMMGILHGPITTRCGLRSMSARIASYT